MVAKIILPNLGGSPSVWTVCLLFFQATLLLGYAYTHLATSNLGVRRRSSVHALLILLPLAILPISDWLDLSLPLILGSLTGDLILVLQFNPLFPTQLTHIIVFGLAVILCLSFAKHRVRFALGLAALLVTSASYTGPYGRLLETKRSFFGVYRVMLDKTEKYHLLLHGNTVHGMQSLVPDRRHEPLSYYSANGPIGQIFALRSRENGDSPLRSLDSGQDRSRVTVIPAGNSSFMKSIPLWNLLLVIGEILRSSRTVVRKLPLSWGMRESR